MWKKGFLLAGILSSAILGGQAMAEPANQASSVTFHPFSAKSQEGGIINQLYAPFLSRHPSIKMSTAVVDLGGKNVGSIFIKFDGDHLCDVRGCLITMLKYDGGQWREEFSQHSNGIFISDNPNTSSLGNKSFYTSNGLLWKWTPEDNGKYYPEIRSVGKPWGVVGYATYKQDQLAKELHPEYFYPGSDVKVYRAPVVLDGLTQSNLLVYQGMSVCGSGGCPFVLVDGDETGGYKAKAQGIFDTYGVTLPNEGESGMRDFAVQSTGGLEFYHYEHGKYLPYMTTFPSKVTEAP